MQNYNGLTPAAGNGRIAWMQTSGSGGGNGNATLTVDTQTFTGDPIGSSTPMNIVQPALIATMIIKT